MMYKVPNYSFGTELATNFQSYSTWTGGFEEKDIQAIDSIGKKLELNKAIIADMSPDEEYSSIRKSKTSWIEFNQESEWLYDRLGYIIQTLNQNHWKFDLHGFFESMQYTVYEDKEDHYTWHIDTISSGSNSFAQRKLSAVVQLSDPDDYVGGDLEILSGNTPTVIPREKGLVTVFPSFMLHRVTPLISGKRKSLVVWVGGPNLK